MKKKCFVMMGFIILIIFAIPIFYYFKLDDNFNDETLEIGITINGEHTDIFPEKNPDIRMKEIVCDYGASGEWNEENWSFFVGNLTTSRTKCSMHFYTIPIYQEEILNGMDPVLKEGLIPVTINDEGVVQKADIYSEWYRYANQKWANAVILEDESISYEEGEEIPEDNIESYFVWIPRYKYKLFNLGNYNALTSLDNSVVQTIDIVFGDTVTDDANEGECTTPMTSGATGNCQVGDYMSHPAFLAFDVNGIWVGKFETGYKGATTTSGAQKNKINPELVEVKPNVYIWSNIQPVNAHLNSYNYKREYDSHMMKNTEWGAVAYLQHSIYGSKMSVRVNNNSNMISGYAAKNEPISGYGTVSTAENRYEGTTLGGDGSYTLNYKNPLSVSASTTNNYTGIYDMSGGGWEYVMGVMTNQSGIPCAGRESIYTSGFAGPYCDSGGTTSGGAYPAEKYYDKYLYSTTNITYNRRILGDAMGEMGPFASITYQNETKRIGSWHQDAINYVTTVYPWLLRGGIYYMGTASGVFSTNVAYGSSYPNGSFRIVLAI